MTATHPSLAGGPVYLDYNATTPIDPAVAAAMQPLPGRPLRQPLQRPPLRHHPAQALNAARRQVAALVGADPDGIVFTGSGSAANNLAIRGTVLASRTDRPHLITQQTEHPAVLATCSALHRLHACR